VAFGKFPPEFIVSLEEKETRDTPKLSSGNVDTARARDLTSERPIEDWSLEEIEAMNQDFEPVVQFCERFRRKGLFAL
jgi:hypothetical protein